jgi:hypothetical protein
MEIDLATPIFSVARNQGEGPFARFVNNSGQSR